MSGEAPTLFVRRASGLVRTVGPFTAFMIVFTHTVGGGIHRLAVIAAYQHPAAFVPYSFLITGLALAIPTALVYTMLGAMMPRTGGDYIFISRGLNPTMGFLASWGFWFTEVLSYGIIAWYSIDFFVGAVTAAGIALNDEGLLATAQWMATTEGHWILGITFVLIFGAIAYLGMRIYGWIINILGTIAIIGCITNLLILGTWGLGPMGAVNGWGSLYGAGAYEKIVAKAFEIGMAKGNLPVAAFDWGATIAAGVGAIWAYIGIVSAVFVGGELKSPGRSLFFAQVAGTILIMLYYITLPFLVYTSYAVPQEVLAKVPGALDYLAKNNIPANRVYFTALYNYLMSELGADGVAKLLGVPSSHLLPPRVVTSFTIPLVPKGMEWLQILNGALVGIVLLKDIPAFFVVASRMIFAWAFDRFFPEMFAAVDSRFHTPYWAVTLTLLGGLVGVALTAGGDWAAAADTSNLYQFAVMLACLAAAVLPYLRRDLYEKSPYKWEIAGVPILTILGLWGWAANFFFFYVTTHEIFYYWGGYSTDIALQQSAWMGIGALIFTAFLVYNTKRGIDVRTIYTEIPPA
ncbi:APC family permease [Candidatus Korarchaeum cryptofilum]|jgi:amino acid transporter|uniref:APC family permease n=1 Tax=Candidatus Korarchaeum cryptofilum TaxID=498846 RepID=A0A429G1J1_9CREN|nr:APC family permease [Candidatus Korarchaeum cryptofilum]RSN67673.1 APC family permease [Candidatus Korarchaeum cryptofilum]